MKKITTIILALTFVLSLTACGNRTQQSQNANSSTVASIATNDTQSTPDTPNVESNGKTDTAISFENVNSLDDFTDKLVQSGFNPVEVEHDDGVITIELESTAVVDDDESIDTTIKPAIPTIDNIEKPQELTPEPSAPDSEPHPDPEVVAPLPEPDPAPQPDPDPAPQPTPQPDVEEKQPQYTYTTGQTHKKLNYTERYLYSVLTDEQKEWYRAIDTAVNNLDATANVNTILSEDRRYAIYYLYMFDNPEHFYLANSVSILNRSDGTSSFGFCYSVGNEQGEYCGYGRGELTAELKEKIKAKKAAFETEASRILSTIPSDAPAVWKERLIYDCILKDGHYNLSAQWDGLANDNWTAYGLLVNKYGVCESYSEAFQTLCLYAGIKCTGVTGTAGGGHKWNAVEIDGEWYMCDITLDDPIGSIAGSNYHYYFNRTSSWFAEHNHDWSSCEYSVPQCDGTKYDFENYFGESRWE